MPRLKPAARDAIAAVALSMFVLIAWIERTHGGFAFDRPALDALHGFDTPTIRTIGRVLAYIGYGVGTLPLGGILVIALFLRRRKRDGLFALTSIGGGVLINTLLKHAFHRARPVVEQVWETQSTYSFPSGHAMATATLAATLIALTWSTRWRWRIALASTAFSLAVGASRVLVGVHYPSDVLAGWAVGVAWVYLVHAVSVKRRGVGEAA